MKILNIILFVLLNFSAFSQRETFQCKTVNTSILISKYEEFKSYGFEIPYKANGKSVDLMKTVILDCDYIHLRQLCIDSWAEVNNMGANSCYIKFINKFKYIDKTTYMDNIDYIEMLVKFHEVVVIYLNR
jgi:hypothetical protein